MSGARDGGTVLPLVLLGFLLAGLMVTAGTAASAAFLAQRDLAGVCDGAALAGAAALDRAALAGAPAGAGLPVDAAGVVAAVEDYRLRADRPGLRLEPGTDGATVTVVCRRTVRIPFGAVLGAASGLDRTAVARARTALLPAR